MKRLNIRIDDASYYRLKDIAEEKKVSSNEIINGLIDDYLASDKLYSVELRLNNMIDSLSEILEEQISTINNLNNWHKIHAELLKDNLNLEYEEE